MSNIRRLQDVQINDSDLIETYRNTFNEQSINEAQNLINTNKLKSYVLQSEWMNNVKTKIEDLEEPKFVECDNVLDNKIIELQFNIDEFIYINEYNNNTQYYKNNFVLYDNEIYFCIKNSLNKIPTNGEYWLKIGLLGEKGQYSLGVVYHGFWNDNTEYRKYDLVTYENNLYVAQRNNIHSRPLITEADYPTSRREMHFLNNLLFLNDDVYLTNSWTNDDWFCLTSSNTQAHIYDSPEDYTKIPIYSIFFQKL